MGRKTWTCCDTCFFLLPRGLRRSRTKQGWACQPGQGLQHISVKYDTEATPNMGKQPRKPHIKMDVGEYWTMVDHPECLCKEVGSNRWQWRSSWTASGQGILCWAFVVHLGQPSPGDSQRKGTEKPFPLEFKKKVKKCSSWVVKCLCGWIINLERLQNALSLTQLTPFCF